MWGMETSDFPPFFAVVALGYLALACLAPALTRRWWSGIAIWPLPLLYFLRDQIELILVGYSSLILGLPVTLAAAAILRQMGEPETRLLGRRTRIGALLVGTAAVLLALVGWTRL